VPRTVLIVDDSPTIRAFARIFLKTLQVDVSEAEDGQKALDAVRASRPDLCVVDVDMPNMDGLSFTREVRKDPEIGRRRRKTKAARPAPTTWSRSPSKVPNSSRW
jgi:CheY-like chemotaxis protein